MELPAGIINPTTPTAFLPAENAYQLEISRYMFVATLAGFLVDWISSLHEEQQLFKTRITLPTAVYLLSRLGTLSYLLTVVLFQTTAVPSCTNLIVATGISYVFSVPVTALLFLLRLRAIFLKSKLVVATFGALWLCVLGASITVPFSISAARIGPTNFCIDAAVKPFISAAPIANTVFGTLVFIAISWRLVTMNRGISGTSRRATFFSGGGSSTIASILLRDGQVYYVVTVGLNIIVVSLILAPTVAPIYHVLFSCPGVALENAMACRVFRNMKLAARAEGAKKPMYWSSGSGSLNNRQHGGEVYPLGLIRAPVEVSVNRQVDVQGDLDTKNVTLDDRVQQSEA